MQKCKNCNEQFSWTKIYHSLWWNYKPIHCNQCGATHKVTIPSRFIFVSLTILPMVIFANFLSPFNNPFGTIGIALFILVIGSMLTPFCVRYKKSE
ncbi:hypothetical protein GMD78_05625 [Ornithinibacillus sp. L9]|uniref:Cxxc_20_cxxc protein n=1 Tax=Ornithinibacillus caprae TaxID=2678566 RepID=A0A6N8FKQ3_9BACI|nr:hypothetical protein [Ornithinibacillus caprae]